jgi:hypothetical protein
VTEERTFLDYNARYIHSPFHFDVPAPIPQALAESLCQMARQAFLALDLSGLARVDFFLDRNDQHIYINEVNTLPGCSATSMYSEMWIASGMSYSQLLDRLIELLVREVGSLEGPELTGLNSHQKTHLLLERVARRLADEYAPLLRSWPLSERVAFVTQVMHVDGGMAEWEKVDVGFEIRDFNCLFHRLLGHDKNEACEWHESFLGQTLAADVHAVACSDTVGQCCRFVVTEPTAADKQPRTEPETILAQ